MGILDSLFSGRNERKEERIETEKDIQELNYPTLSRINDIKIELSQAEGKEVPEATGYFEHRLRQDLSKIITISDRAECNNILQCNFRLSMKNEQTTNWSTGTIITSPIARAEANIPLLDNTTNEIYFEESLTTSAAVSLLRPKSTNEDLTCLALRRLSASVMAIFARVLSQALLGNNQLAKAVELLLTTVKIYGDLPKSVSRGLYANPYRADMLTVYKLPNGDVLFEQDLVDEWGLVCVYGGIVMDALIKIGVSATPFLVQALRDENFWVRAIAVEVLGTLRSKNAVEPLLDVLKNDSLLYADALFSLSSIGDSRGYDVFISALKKDLWPYRVTALKGLTNLADKRAIESISNLLKTEKHKYTRKVAKETLKVLKRT